MTKILISYGDDLFKESLNQIKKEASKLNIFDKIITYKKSDLPLHILSSPLMTFKNGGGYWVWKPYLIWKTLQDYKDAIVVYVDAGCKLNQSNQWFDYFDKIIEYDTIVFKYRNDFDYGWSYPFNCNSTSIKYWTKKNTLNYFDKLFDNTDWQNYDKIMGGFIVAKNHNNVMINEWVKITLLHPELIIDPFGNEVNNQDSIFSTHRHDQSILTPIAHFYSKNNKNVLILDETAESGLIQNSNDIAVLALRRKFFKEAKISFKTRLIRLIKYIVGERLYNFTHGR